MNARAEDYAPPIEVSRSLLDLASAHPDLLKAERIATSRGGLEVLALTLAAPGGRPPNERQALLVTAGLDAGMLHTTEVAVGMLSELVRRRDEPEVRSLLASRTLYWVPQANPDGAASYFARPRCYSPVNSRPVDDDRDGRLDEDGPEDLDGDGEILTLRIPDPEGPWVVDAADDRLLRLATPLEATRARFRIAEEGVDNDGDGAFNEDAPGGVDLARNFPHEFEERVPGAGPYPACEAESKAILDFVIAHPNVEVVLHYGSHDNLVQTPEGRDGNPALRGEHKLFKEDAEAFARLGERYRKTTGLKTRAVNASPKGAWHETLYFDFGIPCLAACLYGAAPPVEGDAPLDRRWLDWNDSALGGAGFVRWRPLDHPQLGRVDIGGWRPFARTNPPRADAARLAPAQANFLVELASSLPRVTVESLRVKDLGEGLFEIKAWISNHGELPTAFAQGAFTGRRSPLNVEVAGDGLRFLSSEARKTLDRLGPRGASELTWLVAGSRGAAVKLEVRLRGQVLVSAPFQLEGGGSL